MCACVCAYRVYGAQVENRFHCLCSSDIGKETTNTVRRQGWRERGTEGEGDGGRKEGSKGETW